MGFCTLKFWLKLIIILTTLKTHQNLTNVQVLKLIHAKNLYFKK